MEKSKIKTDRRKRADEDNGSPVEADKALIESN